MRTWVWGIGCVGLLQPQVLGGEEEHLLRVVGDLLRGFVQLSHGLLDPPVRRQRRREQTQASSVGGACLGEAGQDLDGPIRRARAKEHEGQGLKRVPVAAGEGHRLEVRLAGRGQVPLDPLQGSHQPPALDQRLAVAAAGRGELVLAKAALRHRDRPVERRRRGLALGGGEAGGQPAAEAEGGDEADGAASASIVQHGPPMSALAPSVLPP
jgi:hypothetical protein